MQITPTLHFPGTCAEALALYEEAFGLAMDFILRYKEANSADWDTSSLTDVEANYVYHSEGAIAGQRFMFADEMNVPSTGDITRIFLTITLDTAEQVCRAFAALERDGHVIHPLRATTYSSCMGSIVDKFGFRWGIMTEQTEQ